MPSAVELGVQVALAYPTPELFPSGAYHQAGQPAKVRDGVLEAAPPAGRLPCHFLVSGWWASQSQPRAPGEGTTRASWPRVKAALCTNFSGFWGLGFCFFLLSGNARRPCWILPRYLLYESGIPVLRGPLCLQTAMWGGPRGIRHRRHCTPARCQVHFPISGTPLIVRPRAQGSKVKGLIQGRAVAEFQLSLVSSEPHQ